MTYSYSNNNFLYLIVKDIKIKSLSNYSTSMVKCDFYISAYLEIEHNQGISYYQLYTQCGFYCDFIRGDASDLYEKSIYYQTIDRDDESNENENNNVKIEHAEKYKQLSEMYKEMYNILKEFTLSPRSPIVIYENNSFVTQKLETKYLPIVQNKLNKIYVNNLCLYEDTGSFTDIGEVIKITKKNEIIDFDSPILNSLLTKNKENKENVLLEDF